MNICDVPNKCSTPIFTHPFKLFRFDTTFNKFNNENFLMRELIPVLAPIPPMKYFVDFTG